MSSALLTHQPVSSLAAPPPPETPAVATVSLPVVVPASSIPPPMILGVNPLCLSTPSQLPPSSLPVVPSRKRDRIVRGEFVDLNNLLPERLMLEPDDCFELSVGARRSVSIRPRSTSSQPTRHREHDMASWLEAFILYPSVLMDASPDRAGQLLAYQARILEANNNYDTDAWLAYDLRFRHALATQPHQHSWTTIDVNLWQACSTSRGREACIRCHIVHQNCHIAMPILQRRPYGLFQCRKLHTKV